MAATDQETFFSFPFKGGNVISWLLLVLLRHVLSCVCALAH